MNNNSFQDNPLELIKGVDIYLLDQILKLRYSKEDKILDAGCGSGRNLRYFQECGYDIYGIDVNVNCITALRNLYAQSKNNFITQSIAQLDMGESFFDHIICNAVFHFSQSNQAFVRDFSNIIRHLKVGGTLFIRMTSNIGIENNVELIKEGVYEIPDGSTRFLLSRELINSLLNEFNLELLEPVKTVNVQDIRCMTTLMLKKLGN